MTTRSSTARRFLACLLAAVLVGGGAAGVATATTSHAGSMHLEADDDPLANATGESVDVLENELDESTDELDETTEALERETDSTMTGGETTETSDSIDGTVDGAGDTVTDATGDVDDATAETTDDLGNATAGPAPADATDSLGDGPLAFLESVASGTVDTRVVTPGLVGIGLEARADVAVDPSGGNDGGDETGGDEETEVEADADERGSTPDGRSTATDAVLVGLLGAITASGAAASGAGAGAGAGAAGTSAAASGVAGSAGGLPTGRPGLTNVLRSLRHAASLLPWKLLSVCGYSRYDDSDPLENDRRRAVYETIAADPGCYLSQVSERSGVALSTVRHHVRVLEEEDLVTGAKVNGKRRYVPSTRDRNGDSRADGASIETVELHAALEEPAKRDVLEAIAALGPVSNGRLADDLERDPSTVSHHLSALEDDGLVVRERDGRSVVNELAADVESALGEADATLEEGEPESSPSMPADD